MLLCIPVSFFIMPPVWACIALMAPMVLDGGIQMLTTYESTNSRRFVTGLLFGYGGLALFFISVAATFQAGLDFGHHLFA